MGAGYHGGFGSTRGRKAFAAMGAGDTSFMGNQQIFLQNIKRRKDVDPNGKFDVIAHGTSNSIEFEHNGTTLKLNSRNAAKLIRANKDYHGQDIRLLSCNTGSTPYGFAQNLANKLNVTVWAPNNYLWAYQNGSYVIANKNSKGDGPGSSKGKFIKFVPGGHKK